MRIKYDQSRDARPHNKIICTPHMEKGNKDKQKERNQEYGTPLGIWRAFFPTPEDQHGKCAQLYQDKEQVKKKPGFSS